MAEAAVVSGRGAGGHDQWLHGCARHACLHQDCCSCFCWCLPGGTPACAPRTQAQAFSTSVRPACTTNADVQPAAHWFARLPANLPSPTLRWIWRRWWRLWWRRLRWRRLWRRRLLSARPMWWRRQVPGTCAHEWLVSCTSQSVLALIPRGLLRCTVPCTLVAGAHGLSWVACVAAGLAAVYDLVWHRTVPIGHQKPCNTGCLLRALLACSS